MMSFHYSCKMLLIALNNGKLNYLLLDLRPITGADDNCLSVTCRGLCTWIPVVNRYTSLVCDPDTDMTMSSDIFYGYTDQGEDLYHGCPL